MALLFTTKKLTASVINALNSSEIAKEGAKWELSMPQMSPDDYRLFKKVLTEIHGTWHKGKGVHLFDHDPTSMIAEVVAKGCVPKRRPNDYFPTPEAVVREMLNWGNFHAVDPDDTHSSCASWRYLEPQAGQGGIVDVLYEMYPHVEVDCCEIDDHNREVLEKKGYPVVGKDFLTAELTPGYDWVICNPPFNGANGDYITHINRAWDLLDPHQGRLLAIVPESFLTSTESKVVAFRNKVATYGDWANLSQSEAFASVGTKIECCYIKMERFSDAHLEALEADPHSDWTEEIITSIKCEARWYEFYCSIADKVKKGVFHSKEAALCGIVNHLTPMIYKAYKEECSFRWDDLIKSQVANHLWDEVVDEYFNNVSPLE